MEASSLPLLLKDVAPQALAYKIVRIRSGKEPSSSSEARE